MELFKKGKGNKKDIVDVSSRIMERTRSYGRNEGYLPIAENVGT